MRRRTGITKLMDLAERLVSFARSKGADEVEISISEGVEFDVDVRHGRIENLIEAGSRALGFRLFKDSKKATGSSSDLSLDRLRRLISRAIQRADYSSLDECAGLPSFQDIKTSAESLDLFDQRIVELPARTKIDLALETERLALAESRITNSYGASFESREVYSILVNSNGIRQDFKETVCSLSLGLQAGSTDSRVEGYWSSSARHFGELEPPEEVARKAVERTVRLLNPRKIRTQNVPVIFEPWMTSWLMGFLFSCVAGTSVYQNATFLSEKLGERVGNGKITVIDDGLLSGKLGSAPFDSEGVPTQKTMVVEKGILKNFLCNTYAARKLKLTSTGNASGSGVGPNNFYLEAGPDSPQSIITGCSKGLILTRTIGHGLNPVTGDISRGAFGLWVEDGEIAYPVSEITISGNLGTLLREIESVAGDLDFRSPVCGPTIKVGEMTVAGQ